MTKVMSFKFVSNRKHVNSLGGVLVCLDPPPVGGAETRADGLLRLLDPPPETFPVSSHFLPGAPASCLAGERPGPHDMDVDNR